MTSASEFPEPSHGGVVAGVTSEIVEQRARAVNLRNSRVVCWMTMGFGIVAVPLGICMVLEGGSLLIPLSAISFMAVLAAAQWIVGGFLMSMMCLWLWLWGMRMLGVHVKLDARGVNFNLGTKKRPAQLFMAWEQVASVQQNKVGNMREYTILGKDGSRASYSSNSFFRSKRIARMIAERAGLTIEMS